MHVSFGIDKNGKHKKLMAVPPSNQYIYPLFDESVYNYDIGLYFEYILIETFSQ